MKSRFFGLLLSLVALPAVAQAGEYFSATFTLNAASSDLTFTGTLSGHPSHECEAIPEHGHGHNITRQAAFAAPPALDVRNMLASVELEDCTDPEMGLQDVVITLGYSEGPFFTNGMNPGIIDFSGLSLTFSSGTLLVDGIPEIDFGATPVTTSLSSSLATFLETGGPSYYTLWMDIPIDVSGVMTVDGQPMAYQLVGNLAFDGGKGTPEASSWLLTLAGVGVLARFIVAKRRVAS